MQKMKPVNTKVFLHHKQMISELNSITNEYAMVIIKHTLDEDLMREHEKFNNSIGQKVPFSDLFYTARSKKREYDVRDGTLECLELQRKDVQGRLYIDVLPFFMKEMGRMRWLDKDAFADVTQSGVQGVVLKSMDYYNPAFGITYLGYIARCARAFRANFIREHEKKKGREVLYGGTIDDIPLDHCTRFQSSQEHSYLRIEENEELKRILFRRTDGLNNHDKFVFYAKMLGYSYERIGKHYHVTREWARQEMKRVMTTMHLEDKIRTIAFPEGRREKRKGTRASACGD